MISCNGMQRILGWHINTIRKNVKGLSDIGVHVERKGSDKTGGYTLNDWGAINADWVDQHFEKMVTLFEGGEHENNRSSSRVL